MSICHKELRESKRWIKIVHRVPLINPSDRMEPLLQETEELIKIFVASIRTAEKKIK